MSPTLNHRDQVLAVRTRRPYHRGDVVVFRSPVGIPGEPVRVNIKRVIGLPQEEIVLEEGGVRINGTVLPESYLPGADTGSSPGSRMEQERETARIWMTDAGEYFVMGDQRGDSLDSRSFGPVGDSLMLGRVWLRYWPLGAWGMIQGGGQP